MKNTTTPAPPPVRRALEDALYPIVVRLMRAHGADAVRDGLWQVGALAHVLERRDEAKARTRPGARRVQALRLAAIAEHGADPVEDIRQRHLDAEHRAEEESEFAASNAHHDRAVLLEELDRLRGHIEALSEEPEAPATCSVCFSPIVDEPVHVMPAASTWDEDEPDAYDRAVEVCAACRKREGRPPAPAEAEPRPRLASGVRTMPLRKTG